MTESGMTGSGMTESERATRAILAPELGMPGVPIVVSVWLVPLGSGSRPATAWSNWWPAMRWWMWRLRIAASSASDLAEVDEVVAVGQVLGAIKKPTAAFPTRISPCNGVEVDAPQQDC